MISRSGGGVDHGSPPLLFVHGGWHGAWCWEYRGFLDRVAQKGLDVHALSLRGHGASAGHDRLRMTRVRDYVDDLEEATTGLRAPPVIIGHSMGGFVTQKLMERRRLPGVVLLASAPPFGVARLLCKLLHIDPLGLLRVHLTLRLRPMVATPDRVRRLFFSASMSDAEVDLFASKMGDEAFLAYLDLLFLDLCKPAKGTPVRVMGAEKDEIFSVATTKRIAAAYGVESTIFPDMAHDMMLERGWESVADAIADWVIGGCRPQAATPI
ncbi:MULTISPECIES: alpha/beta hydrolase [Methylosinus]|uniref:alpha/beta hydrolase n=1 Tax=Methylosinus TaxID=425 RepID=UPI0012FFD2EF|nr:MULTISPECIES: alpha/beta fold hydrolase [Methylosinus]